MDIALLVGRILLAAIFLSSGVSKLLNPAGVTAGLAAKGFPFPDLLALIAGLAETAGAMCLIAGLFVRWSSIGLLVFTALATLLFHGFWSFEGEARSGQFIHFMKNVSIIGSFMVIAAVGGGQFSLDSLLQRRARSVLGEA